MDFQSDKASHLLPVHDTTATEVALKLKTQQQQDDSRKYFHNRFPANKYRLITFNQSNKVAHKKTRYWSGLLREIKIVSFATF